MDNFYTMTVYEKGAEVIRMIYQLLGQDLFRKGMDLYFEKFDGMAVTLEDFVGVHGNGIRPQPGPSFFPCGTPSQATPPGIHDPAI